MSTSQKNDPPKATVFAGGPGFMLGRIRGVPVYATASTLVLVLILAVVYSSSFGGDDPSRTLDTSRGYAVALLFAALLLLSVFLHEFGHMIVSQMVGLKVRSITLTMLGGATATETEAPDPGRSYLISMAGPAVSLTLAGLGAVLTTLVNPGTTAHQLIAQIAFTNLLVTGFNLLPGLPLDGGQVLVSGIWKLRGNHEDGIRVAAWVGRGFAVLLVPVAYLWGQRGGGESTWGILVVVLTAVFMWTAASQSLAVAKVRMRLPRLRAGAMARPAVGVESGTPLSEALRLLAERHARGIVVTDPDGRPTGVVIEESVAATPEHRRPWVEVGSVSRQMPAEALIPADLVGEDVLTAMQAHPASEYVVVDRAGHLIGVLSTADVAKVLEPGAGR